MESHEKVVPSQKEDEDTTNQSSNMTLQEPVKEAGNVINTQSGTQGVAAVSQRSL